MFKISKIKYYVGFYYCFTFISLYANMKNMRYVV